jgi:hypothetical protein
MIWMSSNRSIAVTRSGVRGAVGAFRWSRSTFAAGARALRSGVQAAGPPPALSAIDNRRNLARPAAREAPGPGQTSS